MVNCKKCGEKLSDQNSLLCFDCIKRRNASYKKRWYVKNKEKAKEYSRAYGKINRKKITAQRRDYNKAYQKQYAILNKEKISLRKRVHKKRPAGYYFKHRDRIRLEKQKQYLKYKDRYILRAKLAYYKDIASSRELVKAKAKKARLVISSSYAVLLLKRGTNLKAADIRKRPELIEAQQLILKIKRYEKENGN